MEISPELADRLGLDTPTITFLAGETGPKEFVLSAPNDGIFLGETPTELEFVFSSTNTGYNGLTVKIPVKITEERVANILVRTQLAVYCVSTPYWLRCFRCSLAEPPFPLLNTTQGEPNVCGAACGNWQHRHI